MWLFVTFDMNAKLIRLIELKVGDLNMYKKKVNMSSELFRLEFASNIWQNRVYLYVIPFHCYIRMKRYTC